MMKNEKNGDAGPNEVSDSPAHDEELAKVGLISTRDVLRDRTTGMGKHGDLFKTASELLEKGTSRFRILGPEMVHDVEEVLTPLL
jgi:hypothetical protein